MGPVRRGQAAAFLRPGAAPDHEPGPPRQLYGRQAHAAAGAVDEHGLASLGPGPVEERAVGRGVGHADGGPLREGEPLGQGVNAGLLDERHLRVGAAGGEGGIDPASRGQPRAGARGLHEAGAVEARNEGQRRLEGVGPGADIGVGRVDPSGFDPDDGLSGAGDRLRDVPQLQDFRAAEALDLDGFHAMRRAGEPDRRKRPGALGCWGCGSPEEAGLCGGPSCG